MTNSERFIEAHKTAKQIRSCFSAYRDAFAFALKEIYPEVKRIRSKYKDCPAYGRLIDNLRYDLDNLCKQILFCFDHNGCAMRPALPSATYLPYRVQETIDAAMRLLDIASELLPVSLDELIPGLTHEPNPC